MVKSEFKIDPSTGLPALAPNQFWRVEPVYDGEYSFSRGDAVKLVETSTVVTKWLKTEKQVDRVLATAMVTGNTSKESIFQAALSALKDFNARNVRNSLLGDYPPRSVN